MTDLAILAAGGVNVPMFSTLTPPQVEHIVRDSGAKIICVSSEKQMQKVEAFSADVDGLQQVIIFDAIDSENSDGVLTYNQVCDIRGKGGRRRFGLPKITRRCNAR